MSALKDIIEEMKQHRTGDAEPMAAYMRHQFPFLGIKSTARRQITQPYFTEAKRAAREIDKVQPNQNVIDWVFVKTMWQQPEREYQYAACDYLKVMREYLKAEDLNALKELIVMKSWWDSVDALVKTVGFLVHKYPSLKSTVIIWSQAENIWLRRTAIIHQLNMKEQTDYDLLQMIIENNLKQEEFFINKAIGWALRDLSKTNPEWVKNLLLKHEEQWARLTWREASKYLDI